jgi:phosphatidylethanolamine-binding protein (PEBP) family uncharacterized protein
MRRKTNTWLSAGVGMLLPLVAWAADPLGVALTFTARNKCQGESPEIRLTQVPQGTVAYQVQMIDEDVPSFRHWNQTLRVTGPVIPAGAGTGNYYGPCPPSGKHTYRVTVTAVDAAGHSLAHGEYVTQADRN